MDGSSSHREDRGLQPESYAPLGVKLCPICRRHCRSTKNLNKHGKEMHRGLKSHCCECPK